MNKKKLFLFLLLISLLTFFVIGQQIIYNPNQIHVGENVNFSISPIDSTQNFNYKWHFGDGTPQAVNANPVHSFKEGGTYTVTCERKHGNYTN